MKIKSCIINLAVVTPVSTVGELARVELYSRFRNKLLVPFGSPDSVPGHFKGFFRSPGFRMLEIETDILQRLIKLFTGYA